MTPLVLAAAHIKGPHIDWKAFSPFLALAVGGLVVLLVGLFRPAAIRERVVPALTVITFACTIAACIWRFHHPTSIISGALRIDDLALELDHAVRGRGDRDRADVLARGRPARVRARRVLRAAAVQRARDGGVRLGPEPDHAVPRNRAAVDPAVHPVRLGVPARGLARVGAEVPGHRLGRLGHAGVRAGAGLRRHRLDRLRRDRQRAIAEQALRRRAREPDGADRPRADDRRVRVQGVGGAVPPVDPRRLRGRPHPDHRVHGDRHQGRGDGRVPALLRLRRARRAGHVGAAAGGDRRDHDHRRQRRRARAVLAEADARLLGRRRRRATCSAAWSSAPGSASRRPCST